MARCTECDGATHVTDSRAREDGLIRRRRECKACRHRFTTIEIVAEENGLLRPDQIARASELIEWVGGELKDILRG